METCNVSYRIPCHLAIGAIHASAFVLIALTLFPLTTGQEEDCKQSIYNVMRDKRVAWEARRTGHSSLDAAFCCSRSRIANEQWLC
eukprot:1149697-Pelagomonas_calceolata.AAC.2